MVQAKKCSTSHLQQKPIYLNRLAQGLQHIANLQGAREWVNDELFYRDHDPHEIAFDWGLPKPDGPASNSQLDDIGFEEHYSNSEELLNDIQWDIVTTTIMIAIQNWNDSESGDFLRGLYADVDGASEIIDEYCLN